MLHSSRLRSFSTLIISEFEMLASIFLDNPKDAHYFSFASHENCSILLRYFTNRYAQEEGKSSWKFKICFFPYCKSLKYWEKLFLSIILFLYFLETILPIKSRTDDRRKICYHQCLHFKNAKNQKKKLNFYLTVLASELKFGVQVWINKLYLFSKFQLSSLSCSQKENC